MTDTERLIEVLTYATETKQNWWEVFDSVDEASDIIDGVLTEDPSEYEIAYILSAIEEESFFSSSLKKSFRKCILYLRKQMEKGIAEEE